MAQPNRTGSALGKLVVDADLIREVPEAGFSTDPSDHYTCALHTHAYTEFRENPGYHWPLLSEFRNRTVELERMHEWWTGSEREPLAMLGRRLVGKSWLFRRFAHEKAALILVAEQLPAQSVCL
jgi:predicted membrane-bound mannosyltransferase